MQIDDRQERNSERASGTRIRSGGARARYEARKQRQAGIPMAVRAGDDDQTAERPPERARLPRPTLDPRFFEAVGQMLQVARQDAWWYIRHNPIVIRGAVFVVTMLITLYYIGFFFSGEIFPNVSAMGVDVGGMSTTEAADALLAHWQTETTFRVVVDGEVVDEVAPQTLGLNLNAEETARAARTRRLNAIPFGASVEPVIEVNALVAQNYLLDLADAVYALPFEAGYAWQDGEVVGVNGRDGRLLNALGALERIELDLATIVRRQRLDLQTEPLPPTVRDPSLHLAKAQSLVAQSLEISGYDPYTNQHYTWPINAETLTSWLIAAPASLSLREDAFEPFISAVNQTLNPAGNEERYIDTEEAATMIREALVQDVVDFNLRIRYNPTQYVLESGDWGYTISRKTGIPFFLIEQQNSGLNWNQLSIGQQINVPTRDLTMPEVPVPTKRIVVDLERQYLTAFDNGQVIFEWQISSGVSDAPTAPGIYQILFHEEQSVGSSSTLCDAAGLVCGQWQMNWFMGIYEVSPGLVNGFHGAVLLPNGNWLPGGNGYPSTFGCVMSADDLAKQLYDWAEVGTVVEIISRDFPPMSDLGQLALSRLT